MDEDEDSGMMNVSSLLLLSMAGAANGMDGVGDQGAGINAAVLRGGVVGLNRSAGLNTTRDDVMDHPAVQFHIYALYAIIFVVGLLGNVLVVFVVAQNRAMQTVTNCFIANLALSDILLCVLAVPFTPLYFYLNEWIFGKILCHLVVYSQVLFVLSPFSVRQVCVNDVSFVSPTGDVCLRLDAHPDVHRYRSVLCHPLPVPATDANDHLLDHHLGHLVGGFMCHFTLRHLCRPDYRR